MMSDRTPTNWDGWLAREGYEVGYRHGLEDAGAVVGRLEMAEKLLRLLLQAEPGEWPPLCADEAEYLKSLVGEGDSNE